MGGGGGSGLRGLCLEYWILDPQICKNSDPDSTLFLLSRKKTRQYLDGNGLNNHKFSKIFKAVWQWMALDRERITLIRIIIHTYIYMHIIAQIQLVNILKR